MKMYNDMTAEEIMVLSREEAEPDMLSCLITNAVCDEEDSVFDAVIHITEKHGLESQVFIGFE